MCVRETEVCKWSHSRDMEGTVSYVLLPLYCLWWCLQFVKERMRNSFFPLEGLIEVIHFLHVTVSLFTQIKLCCSHQTGWGISVWVQLKCSETCLYTETIILRKHMTMWNLPCSVLLSSKNFWFIFISRREKQYEVGEQEPVSQFHPLGLCFWQEQQVYSLPFSWAGTWPWCCGTFSSSCSSGYTLDSTPQCTYSSAKWPSLTFPFHLSLSLICSLTCRLRINPFPMQGV